MSTTQTSPDYHEITQLSNSELAKRAKAAMEAFIRTIKQGGNVTEKAQLYNAYEDERLKRIRPVVSTRDKRSTKNC